MQSWSAGHWLLATVYALKILSAVGGMWMVGAIYACATSACCCRFGPITSQGNWVIMEARWTRSCDEFSIYTLHVLAGISCMGTGAPLFAGTTIPVTNIRSCVEGKSARACHECQFAMFTLVKLTWLHLMGPVGALLTVNTTRSWIWDIGFAINR